jgi:FdhE protein
MEIEEIIQKRPYLRETLLLYKKIKEFNNAVASSFKGSIHKGDICYPPDIVNELFDLFSRTFNVPSEGLEPLREAMRLGQIDLTRLPHNEISGFLLPYHEDELWSILFIIGRPFFLDMKRLVDLFGGESNSGGLFWEGGRCPLCSARPVISSILEDGRRRLHCSYCGTTGFSRRLDCPVCGNFEIGKDNIITIEGEEDFRIEVCDECGSYIKTVKEKVLDEFSTSGGEVTVVDTSPADLVDLITLPLDIIAQGRGYRRNAPNPLGMLRMA